MRTLYAVHLPISTTDDPQGRSRQDLFDIATEMALGWAGVVADLDDPSTEGEWQTGGRGRARTTDRTGEAGRLVRIDIEHPDAEDPDATRTGTVWLADVKDGDLALRVRLGLAHRTIAAATGRHKVHRPRLVRDVIDRLSVVADGRRLSNAPALLDSDGVYELAELVFDPDRRLPVVIVTPEAGGRTRLRPGHVAEQLAGAAHVVTIASRPASFTLTDRLGRNLTAFNGAVRILWPGATRGDDTRDHPLVLPNRVDANTVWWLQRAVMIPTISTFGMPAIERRLTLSETAHRHGVTDDDEWLADYENLLDELRAKEDELATANALIADLQSELEEREEELEAVREQFRHVQAASPAPVVDEPAGASLPSPRSLREAVEQATRRCQNLVFLDEAHESAAKSGAEIDPQRILDDLVKLDQAAERWAENGLSGGWENLMAEVELPHFVPGITRDAKRHYGDDYERRYKGQTVLLGPHLQYGVRQRFGLRIYWAVDDDEGVFVIGHVGDHLGGRNVDR